MFGQNRPFQHGPSALDGNGPKGAGLLDSAPLGEVGCLARHDSVETLDDGATSPGYAPKKHDDRSHEGSANHQDQQRETTSQNIDGVHTRGL